MLVEKEIIAPGTYWYTNEETGLPNRLDVTPDLTKYWHGEGSKMLAAGLTIPVPFEHDFSAHPMTPRDKLLNNAGWVKEYRLKDNKLFGVVDIQDADIAKKLPRTIRWTSPWISSFTDGQGTKWNNVISHLALTTRPRVTKQAPFSGIAAALSMASRVQTHRGLLPELEGPGICLSRAGRIYIGKRTRRLKPRYPIAFSIWGGGIKLGPDDFPPDPKKKKGAVPGALDAADPPVDDDLPDEEIAADAPPGAEGGDPNAAPDPTADGDSVMPDPDGSGVVDINSDVAMEELLCDLLQALGVPMPDESNEAEFKRHLYEAVMMKVKELTAGGMKAEKQEPPPGAPPAGAPPGGAQPNPLIQQEQQPMYMSLEQINKLPDPMKGVALAMYTENQKLRAEMDASKRVTDSLCQAKLKEASVVRTGRVNLLARLSPRVKGDLEAMAANPAMALSMGDGGAVNDPMATTLAMLEKGLSNLPMLLTTDASALSVGAQPTDAEMLDDAQTNKIVDDMARMMGCPPEKKAG